MKKRIAFSALLVFVISISAISYVFIRSNTIIYKKYNIPLVDVVIPKDSVSPAAGKKIALTRGCYGCYNKNLSGEFKLFTSKSNTRKESLKDGMAKRVA